MLADLNQSELSEGRIQSILELGRYARKYIVNVEEAFDRRRWVIEPLGTTGDLAIEDGERVLYSRRVVGEKRIPIASRRTGARR